MPTGSQQGRDINEANIVRQGLATAAAQDGASSGDAATVGPDGELLFAAAGGGSQPARNVGQAEFDFNAFTISGTDPAPLVFSDGDETMVDLTDPTYPKVVAPGIYAFLAVVTTDGGSSDNYVAHLLVDDNYYSIVASADAPEGSSAAGKASISVVWFCDANDPFRLSFSSTGGGLAVSGRVFVQRVA